MHAEKRYWFCAVTFRLWLLSSVACNETLVYDRLPVTVILCPSLLFLSMIASFKGKDLLPSLFSIS